MMKTKVMDSTLVKVVPLDRLLNVARCCNEKIKLETKCWNYQEVCRVESLVHFVLYLEAVTLCCSNLVLLFTSSIFQRSVKQLVDRWCWKRVVTV